jgi:hypothetical protein
MHAFCKSRFTVPRFLQEMAAKIRTGQEGARLRPLVCDSEQRLKVPGAVRKKICTPKTSPQRMPESRLHGVCLLNGAPGPGPAHNNLAQPACTGGNPEGRRRGHGTRHRCSSLIL